MHKKRRQASTTFRNLAIVSGAFILLGNADTASIKEEVRKGDRLAVFIAEGHQQDSIINPNIYLKKNFPFYLIRRR